MFRAHRRTKSHLLALAIGSAVVAASTAPASAYVVCSRWGHCWNSSYEENEFPSVAYDDGYGNSGAYGTPDGYAAYPQRYASSERDWYGDYDRPVYRAYDERGYDDADGYDERGRRPDGNSGIDASFIPDLLLGILSVAAHF